MKDYWSVLEIQEEYQLTVKPLQVDCVVVRKIKDVLIDTDIGRIFKEHNLFEYKSPGDALNIDTFYKVMAYACVYKTAVRQVNEIQADQITATFVRSDRPAGLFQSLRKEGFWIEQAYDGVYYIKGAMFAAQIVVTSELKKKEYLFLRAMKRKLSRELFEECLKDFEKKSGKERMLADVVLEAITSSNIKQIEEWKGSGSDMCKTMLEIMADELEESRQQGRKQGFQQGKQQGLQLGKQQGLQLGKQQ